MSTQFISRVEREGPRQEFVEVGPGSYSLPGALRNSLPGFAPFASNSKRMAYSAEEGPAPGSYELASVARQTHGAGTLHSKTQRFQDGAKAEQMRGRVPGPGSYSLSSTFKDASTRKGKARPRSVSDALMNSLGAAPASMAPSIPTKFQSYGYELSEGRLELQEPLYPVYSGTRQDAVGPCEYDPKSDLRFRSVSKPNFSKSSERGSLDKMRAKMTEAPGPGYYNHRSDFDLPEDGNSYADTNFLLQLNAARRRQSAVFESGTHRDSLMQDITRRQGDPGPGHYQLPPTLQAPRKTNALQNFSSSGARFQDPTPRSMRLTTAPGAYSPLTSDFDLLRLKVLRQKKMAVRSGWAQNIAFASTESRFSGGQTEEGPPANAYYPRVGIADTLSKPNKRGGAFGAKEKRFKESKSHYEAVNDPYRIASSNLNSELLAFLPAPPQAPKVDWESRYRPKFVPNFAPAQDDRVRPVKTPPGPPPGAYEVRPQWGKVGTHVMAPKIVPTKKRIPDKSPGPGQYNLSQRSQEYRNPKNIMLSSAPRDVWPKPNNVPGPGEYEVVAMEGSLLRASHNVLLSDNY